MGVPVIDTFCFNGEWVVPMRLEYLDPVVDAFVIVESWMTHSGQRKPALFRELYADWFLPYEGKIHWIVLEDFPAMTEEWREKNAVHAWMLGNQESWFRESYQRDVAGDYILERFGKNCIIQVSDADEIPEAALFKEELKECMVKHPSPLYLEQAFFYYHFRWQKPYKWYRAYILLGEKLAENTLTHWRISHIPKYILPKGGWHFSYFMTPEELQKKLEAFAHRECDQWKWRSVRHIRTCMQMGVDLFERVGEHLVPYNPMSDREFPAAFMSYVEALTDRQRGKD
jgi:Glycosyltransferase family 17